MLAAGQELFLQSPWLNAAGILGWLPPRSWSWPQPPGAFSSPPISLLPRSPARERALVEFPGGVLAHTGLPNPGLRSALNRFGARWSHSSIPVWLHLIPANPGEAAQLVRRIEESSVEIFAIELGLPPGLPPAAALEIVSAAVGELPLVVNVPLNAAGEGWLARLAGVGAAALSLGAPRGTLPVPGGRLVTGRLYGPALFPQALAALRTALAHGLPVIAGSGVYSQTDGEALLAAGAAAVQLDTVLWG